MQHKGISWSGDSTSAHSPSHHLHYQMPLASITQGTARLATFVIPNSDTQKAWSPNQYSTPRGVQMCVCVSACIVLYYAVLYCIVSCCIVLYCVLLCCGVLCCIVLYRIVFSSIVRCCVVLSCADLYCIVLYCMEWCCVVCM